MAKAKQLECRIVITYRGRVFALGMYDPITSRYEPLGEHPMGKIEGIVRDLRIRMEKENHIVTFSEVTGAR